VPLSRHRFCAMSGKRLCPDIVYAPCRGNASVPTSFLRHVGAIPLSRRRLRAMSGGQVFAVPSLSCEGTGLRPRAPKNPKTKRADPKLSAGPQQTLFALVKLLNVFYYSFIRRQDAAFVNT